MRNQLFIIGNGFDLFHELNTRYSSFKKYCESVPTMSPWCKYKKTLKDLLDALYTVDGECSLWSDFEAALSRPNLSVLKELWEGVGSEKFRMAFESLSRQIQNAFNQWIIELDKELKNTSLNVKLNLPYKANYITFNYTNTLESLYGIKCLHIHDIAERLNNAVEYHGAVFGWDHEKLYQSYATQEQDLFNEDCREYIDGLRKKTREDVFEKQIGTKNYDDIFILGWSMGDSDCKYVEHLLTNPHTAGAKWHFSCYPSVEAEEEKYNSKVGNIADKHCFTLDNFDQELQG